MAWNDSYGCEEGKWSEYQAEGIQELWETGIIYVTYMDIWSMYQYSKWILEDNQIKRDNEWQRMRKGF